MPPLHFAVPFCTDTGGLRVKRFLRQTKMFYRVPQANVLDHLANEFLVIRKHACLVHVELPKDRAKLVQAGRVQFKIFTMENNTCGQYRDGCCFCFCAQLCG